MCKELCFSLSAFCPCMYSEWENEISKMRITYRNTVARSAKHWCSANAAMCCPLIVELHVNCQQYQNIECCTTMIFMANFSTTTLERTYVFMWSAWCFFFCPILTRFWFPRQIVIKAPPPPVTDFYGNPSNGSNSNTRRQTERLRRHGEAIWRFSRLMRTRLKKNTHTHTEPQSGGLSIFRDSNSEPPNTK